MSWTQVSVFPLFAVLLILTCKYLEEDRDEQNERTRETTEQLREYHYDGLYPRYHWFH